jgi:O-succinylhomoserine sulfhydrylase
MDAHCRNALEIANWLEQQEGIERVFYSGLTSHPQHELAKAQQSGFGGVLSFEVKGGQDAAWRFIDATTMVSITGNLGDVKTTITHPSTTTHGRMSEEDRVAAGIHQNLIRLSVGIEDIGDIKADMTRGLAAL